MAIPVLIGSLAGGAIGGLLASPSPRYHGGPEMSTVNYSAQKLQAGGLTAATELNAINTARHTARDAAAWQDWWDQEVPKYLVDQPSRDLYHMLGGTGTATNTAGVVTPQSGVAVSTGGLANTLANVFSQITGPSTNTAAAAAGTAAAKQAQSSLVTIGLLVAGAIVIGALILRRR